ncbi:MAG TPA: hypothetical protein DHV68_00390 [Dehalococcoidia bacterium]|nr:hypothetical protein [Chloroflexota bacterium]HCI85279.1 hypothetical protein [Dehalococcoidia bacterium]|tara:strand:- start:5140 stop:5364 length:225 start_codon:yes stop_codon:yes gene_type:complete
MVSVLVSKTVEILWNDDRIRKMVEKNSIMLTDWDNSPFNDKTTVHPNHRSATRIKKHPGLVLRGVFNCFRMDRN